MTIRLTWQGNYFGEDLDPRFIVGLGAEYNAGISYRADETLAPFHHCSLWLTAYVGWHSVAITFYTWRSVK